MPLTTGERIRKLQAVRNAMKQETGVEPTTEELAERVNIPPAKVEALLGLSQEDLEIFMMHWFLRMTDAQIARYINMPRRTVNTRRHKAYRLLKKLMGGEADD